MLPQRQHVYSKCILSDNRHSAPDNVQCLHICISCLGNDACRIHRANKEWLTALIWQRFSSPMELHGFKITHSLSSWTVEKKTACAGESTTERTADVRKRTEVFLQSASWTILLWLPTPVRNIGFAEKRDHINRRHFNCFVGNRINLGLAEVESSPGTRREKLTSLEREFFSSSNVLLIAVMKINISPNIRALG